MTVYLSIDDIFVVMFYLSYLIFYFLTVYNKKNGINQTCNLFFLFIFIN